MLPQLVRVNSSGRRWEVLPHHTNKISAVESKQQSFSDCVSYKCHPRSWSEWVVALKHQNSLLHRRQVPSTQLVLPLGSLIATHETDTHVLCSSVVRKFHFP